VNPTTVNLGSSKTSTLTCNGNGGGPYTVTITGTSGSIVHTTTVQVKTKQQKGSSIIGMPLISIVPLALTGLLVNILSYMKQANPHPSFKGKDDEPEGFDSRDRSRPSDLRKEREQ